jgi:flagellar biosynthesis anti-sigma factor FlgM
MNISNGIENLNLTRASGAVADAGARGAVAPSTPAPGGVTGNDQAYVSAVATQLSQALPVGGTNSDVRTGLVQRVQSALATGAYQVSASKVADKMMQSMMVND